MIINGMYRADNHRAFKALCAIKTMIVCIDLSHFHKTDTFIPDSGKSYAAVKKSRKVH